MADQQVEPQILPFVLGFSRAICYVCAFRKECAQTYDDMFICYKAMLEDQKLPQFKDQVTILFDRCRELNK